MVVINRNIAVVTPTKKRDPLSVNEDDLRGLVDFRAAAQQSAPSGNPGAPTGWREWKTNPPAGNQPAPAPAPAPSTSAPSQAAPPSQLYTPQGARSDALSELDKQLQGERAATDTRLQSDKAKAQQAANARAGLGGMGLSGGATALSGDIGKSYDVSRTQALADLDRAARGEKRAERSLSLNEDLQRAAEERAKGQYSSSRQDEEIKRLLQGWDVSAADINGDGLIGGKPVAGVTKDMFTLDTPSAAGQAGDELALIETLPPGADISAADINHDGKIGVTPIADVQREQTQQDASGEIEKMFAGAQAWDYSWGDADTASGTQNEPFVLSSAQIDRIKALAKAAGKDIPLTVVAGFMGDNRKVFQDPFTGMWFTTGKQL